MFSTASREVALQYLVENGSKHAASVSYSDLAPLSDPTLLSNNAIFQ